MRTFALHLQLIEQLIDGAYSRLRATEGYQRFVACRCPNAAVPRFWTYDGACWVGVCVYGVLRAECGVGAFCKTL